jgi:hypothetical protein
MSKKKRPKATTVATVSVRMDRLVDLVLLASQMASDLQDFGSKNAAKYNRALDKWCPN